jgi:hypothetical protein
VEYAGEKMKRGVTSDNKYAGEECSYEEALHINCESIRIVANMGQDCNCSTSLLNETLQEIIDGHIKHTKAEAYCWGGIGPNKLRAQY